MIVILTWLLLLLLIHSKVQGQFVQLYGGTGTATPISADDTQATNANIGNPHSLAADSVGNLYFSDSSNCRMGRIDVTTKKFSTVTGNVLLGSAKSCIVNGDGNLASSGFVGAITGMYIDSNSDLYFADSSNHRIRKISGSTGLLSMVAGNGLNGAETNAAISIGAMANFGNIGVPGSLLVDTTNSGMYFLASSNVVKISATGILSLAASASLLGTLQDCLAIDASGAVHVCTGSGVFKVNEGQSPSAAIVAGATVTTGSVRT
jgi:hypothetical protein